MLALGIDPGTAICGYGLVEMKSNRLKAIEYGAVLTNTSQQTHERLKIIYDKVDSIIKQLKPDVMGIEQLFFNKNVRTAFAVGQARGVVLLAAAHNNIPVVEFTPLQVKQSVVGYGRATKEQVIFMTQKLLSLPKPAKPDDVADALAIAICSLHSTTNCRYQEIKI